MQTLWASVDLGAMAMKGYSAFSKCPVLLKTQHQVVLCRIPEHSLVEFYPSAEMQLVNSASPSRVGQRKLAGKSEKKLLLSQYKNLVIGYGVYPSNRSKLLQKNERMVIAGEYLKTFLIKEKRVVVYRGRQQRLSLNILSASCLCLLLSETFVWVE